jgi:hypothetical protein
MRTRLAILCNLIVPGSGLIVLRREWLGLAAAVLFGVLGQIVLLGLLVVPAAIPGWMTTLSLSAAVFVWLGAQWQLLVRIRTATGPSVERELTVLRRRAAEAVTRREYAEAADILRVALTLNDEDVETNIQWAELMTLTGKLRQADRTWRRVLHLDRNGQHHRRAREALPALPES